MSFQSLISASECATPANPLSQVLKHAEGDRSLQQVGHLFTYGDIANNPYFRIELRAHHQVE